MKLQKIFLIHLKRYQNNLQSMRRSEFVLYLYYKSMYYKYHKINLNCGGSHIDSPDWIKNKTTTIYPINKKDNKCFQYVIAVALNYEEIKNIKITKIRHCINKYNWKGINYSSEKDDWKKIEKNNVIMALNILYAKEEKNISCYVSKHNSNREKLVILSMISNGEGRWHYLAVKNLSALLRRIT